MLLQQAAPELLEPSLVVCQQPGNITLTRQPLLQGLQLCQQSLR
jgi:hypothetical protein